MEKVAIYTRCGSNLTIYRIVENAKDEPKKIGVGFFDDDWGCVREKNIIQAQLEKEHIDAMVDVYYLVKISRFGGVAEAYRSRTCLRR